MTGWTTIGDLVRQARENLAQRRAEAGAADRPFLERLAALSPPAEEGKPPTSPPTTRKDEQA